MFLDLKFLISNDIVSTKIYDKRDSFDFEIVNFQSLDGHVPRSTTHGVYISELILLEHLAILLTSTLTINCQLKNFFKNNYLYHKLYLNCTDNTMI